MYKYLNYLFLIGSLILMLSCGSQKSLKKDYPNVTTKIDEEYRKSQEYFLGELTTEENDLIRAIFETELKVKIPKNKSILINYYQKAPYCNSLGLRAKTFEKIIDNSVRISSEISEQHNIVDFFVFTKDFFFRDKFLLRANFKEDAGFFATNIFTISNNCNALFLLKPNGKFLKRYGGDYFSDITFFMNMDN